MEARLNSRRNFLQKAAFAGLATVACATTSPKISFAEEKNMDAIEAILTRRSIRKFTDKAVSKEDIVTLLRCGMAAPSAGTKRPWEFIVVEDKAKIETFGYSAPLGILCCANTKEELLPGKNFGLIDVTCSAENILIAANALGLGACWKGAYPMDKLMDKFRTGFNLPEHILPVSFVIIGHPDEKVEETERYNAERIHYGTW